MKPLFYFLLGVATTILLRLTKTPWPAGLPKHQTWWYMTALGQWVYSRLFQKKETPTNCAPEDTPVIAPWWHMDNRGNWTVIGSNGKKVKE